MKKTLYEKTMELLKASNETPKQISEATGLGKRWLERLTEGDFGDPGVNKIEILHSYLESKNKSAA